MVPDYCYLSRPANRDISKARWDRTCGLQAVHCCAAQNFAGLIHSSPSASSSMTSAKTWLHLKQDGHAGFVPADHDYYNMLLDIFLGTTSSTRNEDRQQTYIYLSILRSISVSISIAISIYVSLNKQTLLHVWQFCIGKRQVLLRFC